MPIDAPYIKYVMTGNMPGGEKWACSIAGATSATPAQTLAGTTAASSQFLNLATTVRTINTANWTLALLSVYKYAAGATTAADVGSATVGTVGTGTGALPNQTALVATLRTSLATGQGRGRLFLPCTATSIGSAGLIVTATAQSIADAVATFCTSIGGRVVSQAGGTLRPVTSVTVDTRTDVIRARAGRLSPVRVTTVVT